MKVLFVTPWWPIAEKPNFGIFVKEHAEALCATGVEVEVMALLLIDGKKWFSKTYSKEILESGVVVHVLRIDTRFQKWLYNFPPTGIKWFLSLAKKVARPDVIVGQVAYPTSIWAQAVARYFKVPYFMIEHWTKSPEYLKKGLYKDWVKSAMNLAEGVLPVSRILANELKTSGLSAPLTVLPNVVDLDIFSYQAKERKGAIQFLSIMELGVNKAPDISIKALAELRKRGIDLAYSIVGDGLRRGALENLGKELGLPIRFLPRMKKEELAKQLHEADFLLHASHIETFGVVVAEAMATGTPVLVSDLAVLEEMVGEGFGFLITNTVEAWIGAIEKAIAYPFDTKEMSEWVAKNCSGESVGMKLKGILEKK